MYSCFILGAKKNARHRVIQTHGDAAKHSTDLWPTLKSVLTNGVWILLTIAGTVEGALVQAISTFFPKVKT